MDTGTFVRLVLAAFSLWLVTFFASMEAAFSAADRLALSHLSHQKKKHSELAFSLSEDREQLLATILMGTNLAVVLFTVNTTSLAIEFSPFGIYTVPATALLVILLINIFGELLPKTRAARSPLRYALQGTRLLAVVHSVFAPLSHLLVALPKRFLQDKSQDNEETEIRHMVEYAEEQKALPVSETEMILGVLDSGHTQVREIMVPRVDIYASDIEDGVSGLLSVARQSGFSRIPVYEHTVDNILGIVHAKDLLPLLYGDSHREPPDIHRLIKPTLYIPGSKPANELLRDLQESRIHMAMIIDEYGGVAGLVTIEDLIEEIVGEIRDEYDRNEENVSIMENPDGSLLIHGRVSLDDLDEALGQELQHGGATTVAGLMLERLGRIPQKGDCLVLQETGHTLCAERTQGRRILLVRVRG
jgi:CBS domain containing-hemolysin-like protein